MANQGPRPIGRVAVVTHFYSPGPAHELVDYLVPRAREVVFLGQPLPAKAGEPSFYRFFQHGDLVTERTGGVFRLPDLGRYLKDFLTVVWFFTREPRFDLVVALDPLNAAAVNVGRLLNWFPTFVYYTIDYVPNRFGAGLLNRFYHWLDRSGVAASDWTWNLSERMAAARAMRWGTHALDARQLTVPMGTHELRVDRQKPKAKDSLVFMGHLRAGQGVETLLEATAVAAAQLPGLTLTIVGGGEQLEALRAKAKQLGLTRAVRFTGFVADNEAMRRYLLEASLAVALYEDRADNFTRYTDPGKPKEYLAAGLPVLISDVPAIARTIAAAGAGIVVDDSPAALAAAMVALLKNPKRLAAAQTAALKLAQEFRWERIYTTAFAAMDMQ